MAEHSILRLNMKGTRRDRVTRTRIAEALPHNETKQLQHTLKQGRHKKRTIINRDNNQKNRSKKGKHV